MAGLVADKPPARPRGVDWAALIAAPLTPPPESLGVTHWSSRLLGLRLGADQDPNVHHRLEPPQHPLIWTKPADQILDMINPKT